MSAYEGNNAPTSVTNTATSASSTAAIDANGSSGTPRRFYFSVKGADVHILFGTSAVAAASTSNGAYLPAGAVMPFDLDDNSRYFRVIATSTVSGSCVSWWAS